MSVFGENDSCLLSNFLQTHIFWKFDHISRTYNQINYRNIWFVKVTIILIMMAQVLFFKKTPHFNAVEPTKMGRVGVMKFWAILQIIVDGFWGGRCSVCVCVGGGRGGGVFFYSFGGPHVQKVNIFFSNTCKCFPTFFWLLLHYFHTESMWKFQG